MTFHRELSGATERLAPGKQDRVTLDVAGCEALFAGYCQSQGSASRTRASLTFAVPRPSVSAVINAEGDYDDDGDPSMDDGDDPNGGPLPVAGWGCFSMRAMRRNA